ncbi:MAG TPA: hypothetical protein VMT00_05310 [Thermoanaerobaculia bacterium]|nr:hypothetical protein [Thermoanaerobaculia bacterium]
MPKTTLERLDENAKVWIFGADRPLTEGEHERFRAMLDRHLAGWTAHGAPVTAAAELREGRLLIVAADSTAHPSGCSIDTLFDLLRQAERELGVSLLDSTPLFYRRGDGSIASATRAEFRRLVEQGEISGDTVVFDNSVDRLGDLRNGAWEKRARDSWHAAAFGIG